MKGKNKILLIIHLVITMDQFSSEIICTSYPESRIPFYAIGNLLTPRVLQSATKSYEIKR
jgi:hypothetical protein